MSHYIQVRKGRNGRATPRPVASLHNRRIQTLRATDRRQFSGVASVDGDLVTIYTGVAGKPPIIPVDALSDVVLLDA